MATSKTVVLGSLLLCVLAARAQVLTPTDVSDAHSRQLQQQYMPQLKAAGDRIGELRFPYHFYLSPTLDVSERQQQALPHASVHFDKFENQTVLQITGNYFASYSTQLLNSTQRARQTFHDVMLPLLNATVPQFGNEVPFQAYALEISHHVRGKVLGVDSENAENFVLILPRSSAEKLVAARDTTAQQTALLDGKAYLNGEPMTLWLSDDLPAAPVAASTLFAPHSSSPRPATANKTDALPKSSADPAVPAAAPAVALALAPAPALHDASADALQRLQQLYQNQLKKMTVEMSAQAQLVSYASPSFVEFRHGAFLQVSSKTTLPAGSGGSQYRLAALAFDSHITHLIRPVLAYFADQPDFDGIDFSTTVLPGGDKAEAVEFVVPMAVLRCYQAYDCTGQQLINASFVLINGERVSLDLQSAEAQTPLQH